MKRLDSIQDEMRGVVTYELPNGQHICVDRRAVEKFGAERCIRWAGCEPWDEGTPQRLPVRQEGKTIGTLPRDFDPALARVLGWIYDIRPGDFTRTEDGWDAHWSIGPGDFLCIPGFEPERKGA